jgi:hypothetical protein
VGDGHEKMGAVATGKDCCAQSNMTRTTLRVVVSEAENHSRAPARLFIFLAVCIWMRMMRNCAQDTPPISAMVRQVVEEEPGCDPNDVSGSKLIDVEVVC